MILTSWSRLILFLSFILSLVILTIPDDSKLGEIYFNSFKYDEALYYFDRAKNQDVSSVSVLKKMKAYFVIQGELKKAITSQKKITKILPKNIFHIKELAKLYDWNNQPKMSLNTREKVIQLENKKSRYKELLDVQQGYVWLREYKEAERIGQMIYESNDIKDLEKNLAFYLAIKNQKEVIKHINKISKLSGKKNYRLQKYLAQSYELNKEYKLAINNYIEYMRDLEKIKKNEEKDTFILEFSKKQLNKHQTTIERIVLLYDTLGERKKIAKINRDYYTIDESKYDLGLDAAEIYLELKDLESIKIILPKIYSVNSAKRLFRAGHIYLELKDFDQSIKFFERVLKLYPYKSEYFKDLSYLYEVTNQPKKALDLQYKLLKLLKKDKQGSFYINIDEVLVTDTSNSKVVPTNEIINTQKKIIELLEKIGDKKEKHKKLVDFTKSNPYDFELNKTLAFSYLSSNEIKEAELILTRLFNINPLDRDVNLYFVRQDIQNARYSNALNKINLLKKTNKKDLQIETALYEIYKRHNPKLALRICKSLEKDKTYDYIELKVNCLIQEKKIQESLSIIYDFSKDNPDNSNAKIKLAYTSILAKDLELANRVISDLKSSNTPRRLLEPILKYKGELVQQINLTSSWEHSIDLNNFKSGSYNYWSHNVAIYKNTKNIGLGVNLFKANPNKGVKQLGHNNISLKYAVDDNLSINGTLGNNFGNSKEPRYGLSAFKSFDSGIYFNIIIDKNKQIYDTEEFATTKNALKDTQSIFIKKIFSLKHDISFTFSNDQFSINDKEAKSINWVTQYNYYLLTNWSIGFLNSRYHALSGDDEVRRIIIDSSNLYAIDLRNKLTFFNNKLINTTDLLIGMDEERSIDFGEYISIRTQLFYNLTLRKQFYFEISYSNESFEIESQDSLTTSTGYNYWF